MNRLSAKGPIMGMKLTTMHGSSTTRCALIEGLVIYLVTLQAKTKSALIRPTVGQRFRSINATFRDQKT